MICAHQPVRYGVCNLGNQPLDLDGATLLLSPAPNLMSDALHLAEPSGAVLEFLR